MRSKWLLTLILLGVALPLGAPSTADAQRRRRAPEASDGPTDEQRATARAAYGRGEELLGSGDFAGAEAAFQEAYAAIPNPVVLLGVARSRERGGNATGAVEAYEQYLAERTDAPDRAEIEAKVAELRALPATLVISSTPVGASITLDGEAREEVTPAELEVSPGEHVISIGADGYEDSGETIEVSFGERFEHSPVLVEAAVVADEFGEEGEGAEEPAEEPEPAAEDEGDISAGVWVASALAGVGLITGTVLGFLALSEQSSFDDMPTTETADKGETLALFADVSFGVAIAAAITAIVLYVTDKNGDEDDEDDESAELLISPTVGVGGGGVAASVTF